MEFEYCPCAASSADEGSNLNLGSPLNSEQNIGAFFQDLSNVQKPSRVWDMTFMNKPNCQAAMAEPSQVTTVGFSAAACQSLPTKAAAASATVEPGYCARFWYSTDCTGTNVKYCDEPDAVCARAFFPNQRYPQDFGAFDVVFA